MRSHEGGKIEEAQKNQGGPSCERDLPGLNPLPHLNHLRHLPRLPSPHRLPRRPHLRRNRHHHHLPSLRPHLRRHLLLRPILHPRHRL